LVYIWFPYFVIIILLLNLISYWFFFFFNSNIFVLSLKKESNYTIGSSSFSYFLMIILFFFFFLLFFTMCKSFLFCVKKCIFYGAIFGSITPNSFSSLFYGRQGEDKSLKMLEINFNHGFQIRTIHRTRKGRGSRFLKSDQSRIAMMS